MLISHSCRFVLFPDPLGACPWIMRGLEPWADQHIASSKSNSGKNPLFHGMAPAELELAFDMLGIAFRSYTRIAVVRNPYVKMAQLYDRIVETDAIWYMRKQVGVGVPDYLDWLRRTSPSGNGAGTRLSPRWRRFGAWSTKAWCSDKITHVVRAETAPQDLAHVFDKLNISPAFGGRREDSQALVPPAHAYSQGAKDIIRERYSADLALYGEFGPNLRLVA